MVHPATGKDKWEKEERDTNSQGAIYLRIHQNPSCHLAGYSVVRSLSEAPAYAAAIASALRSGSNSNNSSRVPQISAKAAALQGYLSFYCI